MINEQQIKALIDENIRLRILLARSKEPCIYCGLPAEDMNRCPHGFPGCGRGDDLSVGYAIDEQEESNE